MFKKNLGLYGAACSDPSECSGTDETCTSDLCTCAASHTFYNGGCVDDGMFLFTSLSFFEILSLSSFEENVELLW